MSLQLAAASSEHRAASNCRTQHLAPADGGIAIAIASDALCCMRAACQTRRMAPERLAASAGVGRRTQWTQRTHGGQGRTLDAHVAKAVDQDYGENIEDDAQHHRQVSAAVRRARQRGFFCVGLVCCSGALSQASCGGFTALFGLFQKSLPLSGLFHRTVWGVSGSVSAPEGAEEPGINVQG